MRHPGQAKREPGSRNAETVLDPGFRGDDDSLSSARNEKARARRA